LRFDIFYFLSNNETLLEIPNIETFFFYYNPNRQGLSVSNFNTNAIQIFPNPTTSTINIKINNENII